jgi:hypothetical protein
LFFSNENTIWKYIWGIKDTFEADYLECFYQIIFLWGGYVLLWRKDFFKTEGLVMKNEMLRDVELNVRALLISSNFQVNL